MKEIKKTGKKGEFLYVFSEKKRRAIKTAFFFSVPILLLVVGILVFGSRENWVTIVSIVLCLPAGKQLVGLIMIMMYQSINEKQYKEIEAHKGSLTMSYEMVLTNYEKNTFVDVFAICGNEVVGYSGSEKADLKYAEKQTEKILRHNGYPVNVKIMKDYSRFLERLDSLNQNEASLRADIPFEPDSRYPDLSREDLIKHTILAISL